MDRGLLVALWFVSVGLLLVVCNEFSTQPDSDVIEHQFDPTWGDRVAIFFGSMVFFGLSILPFVCVFFAISARRAERARHAEPPAN